MPLLFAASLLFMELSFVWRNLPEISAVLNLVATTAVGGLLLWIGMAFAARQAAKERGMQRAFRLPVTEALVRLEALATETKGSLGKVIRYPVARWPIRADLSTPEGMIRLQRFGSRATVVKVLRATDWSLLASGWEKAISDAAQP